MHHFKTPYAKQSGFSLLELIVVIAIIALLSLGAIVVYDGLTDKAQATISTRNAAGLNIALRQYKATTYQYPDRWDNLVTTAVTTPAFLATTTTTSYGYATLASAIAAKVSTSLINVGINVLMERATAPATGAVEPNDQFNAASATAFALAGLVSTPAAHSFSILPTFGSATCVSATGMSAGTKLDVAATAFIAADGTRQNFVNPDLAVDKCNLVLALGFGREAARSTNGESVDLTTAPLYVSATVNPGKHYARYIALFHVAQDGTAGATANDFEAIEVFTKAKLLTILDPEGRTIEENITAQNKL